MELTSAQIALVDLIVSARIVFYGWERTPEIEVYQTRLAMETVVGMTDAECLQFAQLSDVELCKL